MNQPQLYDLKDLTTTDLDVHQNQVIRQNVGYKGKMKLYDTMNFTLGINLLLCSLNIQQAQRKHNKEFKLYSRTKSHYSWDENTKLGDTSIQNCEIRVNSIETTTVDLLS